MERVELARECEGVQVPSGNKIMLEKGLEAFITQALGGTFTVQVPAYGGLFRIAGKDADALGKTPAEAGGAEMKGTDLESMVWEQLKTCYDPEIPVNIVDLGLVYGMEVKDADDGTKKVEIKMTMMRTDFAGKLWACAAPATTRASTIGQRGHTVTGISLLSKQSRSYYRRARADRAYRQRTLISVHMRDISRR